MSRIGTRAVLGVLANVGHCWASDSGLLDHDTPITTQDYMPKMVTVSSTRSVTLLRSVTVVSAAPDTCE